MRWEYQTRTNECGICCIVILASFFGVDIRKNEIYSDFSYDNYPISLRKIMKILDYYKINTRALKCNSYNIDNVKLPAIAHFKNNHFVIIYKINKNGICIFDPQIGHTMYTRELFKSLYSGYVIEPTINKIRYLNRISNTIKRIIFTTLRIFFEIYNCDKKIFLICFVKYLLLIYFIFMKKFTDKYILDSFFVLVEMLTYFYYLKIKKLFLNKILNNNINRVIKNKKNFDLIFPINHVCLAHQNIKKIFMKYIDLYFIITLIYPSSLLYCFYISKAILGFNSCFYIILLLLIFILNLNEFFIKLLRKTALFKKKIREDFYKNKEHIYFSYISNKSIFIDSCSSLLTILNYFIIGLIVHLLLEVVYKSSEHIMCFKLLTCIYVCFSLFKFIRALFEVGSTSLYESYISEIYFIKKL